MLWLSLLGISILRSVCATPTPHRILSKREDAVFTIRKANAITERREISISDSVFLLQEVAAISKSSRALLSASQSGVSTLLSNVEYGLGWGVKVDLSTKAFTLLLDTGSSDLWVAETGFQCVSSSGNAAPEKKCQFGPLFSGQFQSGQVPGEHFLGSYGDGEEVAGVLGYEDVTAAGVTVKHQEIASVQLAYWQGDGISSGIMGFAYSTLTDAYKGNDITKHNANAQVHYTNFLGNAIKQGLIDPSFSIVLERPGGQSQLVLGGLPSISSDQDFTSVPLQIVEFSPRLPIGAKKYTYYTIDLDGFVVNGNTIGTNLPVVVDSGTALAYLAPALAKTINEAFDPPAQYSSNAGLWEADCDATPPAFLITIGGTEFHINPKEVLLPKSVGYDPDTGLCATGIQQVPQQPYILGGTFLKSVVAVFDIGAGEMRFAPHVNY